MGLSTEWTAGKEHTADTETSTQKLSEDVVQDTANKIVARTLNGEPYRPTLEKKHPGA
jgi:hypothetical protein